MATEVFSAKEGTANPINALSRPLSTTRQKNAIMKANIEPSPGRTTVNLGGGYSARFDVHYINRYQGYIRGTLNSRNVRNGQNQFRFGGSTGMSFEEALDNVKRDMRNNV